jgi:PST family polysaccharide transporter
MSNDQDLRERTVAGLNWRFLTVVFQFAFQFGIGVLLARLLPPEDFGLVGLALIVIGFGRIVNDLGLAEAIVQREDLTNRHIRVGFTSSVLLGLGLTACMYGVAPFAADALRDSRVTPLLRFIGVSFFFSGFSIVGEALLKRRLRFKQLMYVELISFVLGYGAVAIVLALSGFGEWSLAWGHLAQKVINSVLAYAAVRHALTPLFARTEFMQLASFGTGSTLLKIFNYAARQGDYFVIGRLLGPDPLGLYTRAYQLMKKPLTYTGQVLSSVLFPAVSRIQGEEEKVREAYAKAISVTAVVVLPSMVMFMIFAPEIVVGLYGEKWTGAIVPLQVLAAFGLFRTVYHVGGAFMKAHGHVYRLFFFQIVYASCVIGGTWVGATSGGINGAALAVGGAITVMYLMVVSATNILTSTSVTRFLKMHVPSLITSVPTAAFGLGSQWALNQFALPRLVVFVAGSLLTGGGLVLFFRIAPHALIRPVSQIVRYVIEQEAIPAPAEAVLRWIFLRSRPQQAS